MISLSRREVPAGDAPDMTAAELEVEWRKAKDSFDEALAQKTRSDRTYVTAATRLNTLDRLVKKVEQRAALARREAAKSLLRASYPALQA